MDVKIDIDQEVWAFLRTHAEPFTDTPNTVLRRVLGLDRDSDKALTADGDRGRGRKEPASTRPKGKGKGGGKSAGTRSRTRAPSGSLLPEERYVEPLLRALEEAGGRAPYREVVEAVGQKLDSDLTELDREPLNSGSIRWQSRLQFVRLRLIERGYLDRETPRGVWGISDAGREALLKGELQ